MNNYGARQLCAAIVLQAVQDWQLLCKQGKKCMTRNKYPVSLTEIRQFLNSEYALEICIGIEPSEILEKLEAQYVAAFKGRAYKPVIFVERKDTPLIQFIRQYMFNRNITQTKFAGKVGIGTSTMTRIMCGGTLTEYAAIKLANAMGVSADELMGLEEMEEQQ